MSISSEPRVIDSPSFVDHRGVLWPIELDAPAMRFYIARNHEKGHIRAWHGHPKEWRVIRCIRGRALVAALNLETKKATAFTVIENTPYCLYFPPGHATGWQSLTEDATLLFVSPAHYKDRDDVELDQSIERGIWA